jgi:hypothetical protein
LFGTTELATYYVLSHTVTNQYKTLAWPHLWLFNMEINTKKFKV